jgi:eukaryotic-like serine/threonine-protein kinase
MAKCAKCSNEVPENAQVCPACGQAVGQPLEPDPGERKQSFVGLGFERYSSTTPPDLTSQSDLTPPPPTPKSNPDHTINISGEKPDRGDIQLSPTEELFEESLIATRRYKIKKLVGRGGMGLVYLAFDRELGLEVALKSLPIEATSDPRYLEMLKQEAKLSMQLTHHNIVRLFDLKSEGESRFMVMEFIPGFSLNDYLFARGRLSEEEAWEVLKPVAQALSYAHSQKVIHRDIKPGNILFKTKLSEKELGEYFDREKKYPDDLDVKVADFGIARTVSDTMARVTHIPVSGTLSYMSSEQLRGKRQTQATDVYSLAAVAYELLCGHPPFHQGEIQYQILNEDPEPIPGVKQEYMDAILKGLSKNPDDRPGSAVEFLELPQKILSGGAVAPTQPRAQATLEPARKKSSRIFMIAALLVLLVVAASLSTYFMVKRQKPASVSAPKDKGLFEPGWQAKDAAPGWVNALSMDANSEYLASAGGNVIKLWKLPGGEFVRSIESHKAEVTALAFNPANNALASADKDGQIDLLDFADNSTVTLKAGQQVNALCFKPDGKILAAASPGEITLWDPANGQQVKSFKGVFMFPSNTLDFSPDGRLLAAAGSNSVIKLFDLAKKDPVATFKGNILKTINSAAFDPDDEKLLATAGTDHRIHFWEAPSGNKIKSLPGHDGAVIAIAFSPDGKLLASLGADDTTKIWSVADGNLAQSIKVGANRALAFNDKYLVLGGCAEKGAVRCGSGQIAFFKNRTQQAAPPAPASAAPTTPRVSRTKEAPKSDPDPGFHKAGTWWKNLKRKLKDN